MTTVVIAYATTEGHTRTIVQRMAERVSARGFEVRLVDCADDPGPDALAGADAAILAGSVHMARFQASLLRFINTNRARLDDPLTAFVAVSLAAQSDDEDGAAELGRYRRTLIDSTHWTPNRYHDAAGALKYAEYDFFKRWIMRRIARDKGMPTAPGEYVFTDWAALDQFTDAFADALASAA